MSKTDFKFDINFENENLCSTIYDAIRVEAQDKTLKRGSIDLSINGSVLSINIEADDIVAARSIFNSLLRVTKTSFDIAKIIDFNE